MRKLAVVALVAGLLAVVSTGTAGGAPAQHALVKKPTAAVQFNPAVVIVGRHFKARERLTVTLVGFKTYIRRVRATATGSFRIDIGAIPLNDCNAYKLKVVGALGSRFSLTHPTAPC